MTGLPWILIAIGTFILIVLGVVNWVPNDRAVNLRNLFAHYIPPELVDEMTREPGKAPSEKWAPSLYSGISVELIMSVIITIAILGAALFIILSGQYSDSDAKWAYGSLGTVIGY